MIKLSFCSRGFTDTQLEAACLSAEIGESAHQRGFELLNLGSLAYLDVESAPADPSAHSASVAG